MVKRIILSPFLYLLSFVITYVIFALGGYITTLDNASWNITQWGEAQRAFLALFTTIVFMAFMLWGEFE